MTLDELKSRVDRDLTAASRFITGKRKTLPDSNLFERLTATCYRSVDVAFDRSRLTSAHLVEITSLDQVIPSKAKFQELLKKARPKLCFQNAYQLSWDFGWNYCEGFFIDARYLHLIDHAWNRTADGLYVDVTDERLSYRNKKCRRMADDGVYVCYYEIPPLRVNELVKEHSKVLDIWQLLSKIEWFSGHDPDRLKPGPHVIRFD